MAVPELTGREVVLLRKAVQTLTTFKADSDLIRANVDGRRVHKNQKVERFLSSTSGSVTYDTPKRFYVRVKKEEVRVVEQVCLELDDEELSKTPTANEYEQLNSKNTSLNEYHHKYQADYGYSVAVTQQNLSSERPTVVTSNQTMTWSLPEDTTSNGSAHEPGDTNDLNFTRAVFLVMDRDLSERWRKRGSATWLGVFFSVVAMVAFFADIVTDLKVAADHYTAGSNWWASFTLMLVLLPSVVTNLVSFFWHKEDEQIQVDEQIGERPQSDSKIVFITHLLLGGMVERYWRILVKSYKIAKRVETIRWAVKYYILTVIEILIFSLLWFTNKTRLLPIRLEMAGFIAIYLFFSLGLIMMSIYYTFLHPRFKEARFSFPPPELADTYPKGTDGTQRQIFELWI